ncbi:MAG: hypothetical protein JWM37_150 [Candidatus Saccharibacteria bacterium]|nr:hypothetical protein [Candidatus Saccharibacteria bacterium]
MAQTSPFVLIRQLESQLNGQLMHYDVSDMAARERRLVIGIRRDIVDARLDTRDYELSETRQEQLDNAKAAIERLEVLRSSILALSEQNVFGAADVAQLTAKIEQIIVNLQ